MPFPIKDKYIIACEAEFGRELPQSYKKKMIKLNGGELDVADDVWFVYPIYNPENRKTIKRTFNHVIAETRRSQSWSEYPLEAVSIADNGTGDKLIFLPDGNDRFSPIVYLWEHETGNVIQVAEDFSLISDIEV